MESSFFCHLQLRRRSQPHPLYPPVTLASGHYFSICILPDHFLWGHGRQHSEHWWQIQAVWGLCLLYWPGQGLYETPGDFDGWHTAATLRRYWTQGCVDCRLVDGNWGAPRTLKDTPEMETILKGQTKKLRKTFTDMTGRSLTGCSRPTCSFFILSCGCGRHCWRGLHLGFSAAFIHAAKGDPGIQNVKQGDFCEKGNTADWTSPWTERTLYL